MRISYGNCLIAVGRNVHYGSPLRSTLWRIIGRLWRVLFKWLHQASVMMVIKVRFVDTTPNAPTVTWHTSYLEMQVSVQWRHLVMTCSLRATTTVKTLQSTTPWRSHYSVVSQSLDVAIHSVQQRVPATGVSTRLTTTTTAYTEWSCPAGMRWRSSLWDVGQQVWQWTVPRMC